MRFVQYPAVSANTNANPADPADRTPSPENTARRFVTCSTLLEEGRFLLAMGIGKPLLARAMLEAQANGTTAEAELLSWGGIDETAYFESLAEQLGLRFMAEIDPERVHDIAGLDSQLADPRTLRLLDPMRAPLTVIVPSATRRGDLETMLARAPRLKSLLVVSTPSAVRTAVWTVGRHRRVIVAISQLSETRPGHSARTTLHGKQGFYAGAACGIAAAMAVVQPAAMLVIVHVLLTLFYLLHLVIRIPALLRDGLPSDTAAVATPQGPLPVYSVLVPLYRESAVVPQLVAALDRLDWPRSRLDIKLICEEDDAETLDALSRMRLSPVYEIVKVPASLPRTKPKALTYAMAGLRGSFVTVYDAEDRPDPSQLRAAYAAFCAGGEKLVCLQAPLVITNPGASWLSALFALEYAGLFRSLLPDLAARRLPLPLGGTSNHFRGLM